MSGRMGGVNVLARVVAAMDAIEDGAFDLPWEILRELEIDISRAYKWKRAA